MTSLYAPLLRIGIEHAVQTVNFLASRGYKVSMSKEQLVQQKVTYLGIILTPKACSLAPEKIQGILQLPDLMPHGN